MASPGLGLRSLGLLFGRGGAASIKSTARALFHRPPIGIAEGHESLIDVLGKAALFETLDRRELARVARIVHERDYANGEYICEEGRPGAAVFIVRRGVVEVIRRGGRSEEASIAVLEPPASFDESAAIGVGTIRWFSVRARGPVSLLALGQSDLDALTADLPGLANKILVRLAGIMAVRLQTLIELEMRAESDHDDEAP
jgi:CRP/FNR family transcriptional regulator